MARQARQSKNDAPKEDENKEQAEQQEEKKPKTLDQAMADITKTYGEGIIMKMSQSPRMKVETIPTGAIGLDKALGVGGLPRGRIVEIYGPPSGGKTTLTLSLIAQCQKQGGVCAFVDAEHALDIEYAAAVGVNVDEIYLSQPDYGEQGIGIVEKLVETNLVDLIIVDSVAALTPKKEIEGDIEDSAQPGLQARMMSQSMRRLTAKVSKTNTIVVFINQLRQKIGVMFGNPETTPGGEALKFFASVRLDIRKIETLKKDGEEVGNRVKVKVVKNKVAPPFKVAEFDIIFGKGVSAASSLLDLAVEKDLMEKAGAWYSYNGERIAQGRDQAVKYLEAHPQVAFIVEEQLRTALGI